MTQTPLSPADPGTRPATAMPAWTETVRITSFGERSDEMTDRPAPSPARRYPLSIGSSPYRHDIRAHRTNYRGVGAHSPTCHRPQPGATALAR
jgi:hypothetical protein